MLSVDHSPNGERKTTINAKKINQQTSEYCIVVFTFQSYIFQNQPLAAIQLIAPLYQTRR